MDKGMSDAFIAWIGPISEPFDWVFENCASQHFIRQWPDADSWFAETAAVQSRFSHILFALPRRDRLLIERINSLHGREPIVSICGVLSDQWLGHRRSSSPKLRVPAFYWWNLQDQILPWLNPNAVQHSIDTFQGKLSEGNEYWQRVRATTFESNSPQQAIVLTGNERAALPILEVLNHGLYQTDVIRFSSDLPEKQLEQLSECNVLSTQLKRVLQEANRASHKVQIWWCGGTMSEQSIESVGRNFSGQLSKNISLLKQYGEIDFGWYATLVDQRQWKLLRNIGFTRLVAPPFRVQGLCDATSHGG
jgi:hypothetical protein